MDGSIGLMVPIDCASTCIRFDEHGEYAASSIVAVATRLITNKTVDTLELGNIAIEVRAASFRRLRGPTYVALQCTCISTN